MLPPRIVFRGLSILGAVAIVLMTSTANAAEQTATSVWHRPLALYGVFGFGTPVGYAGLLADVSPIPLFSVSVGAGLGSGTFKECADGSLCDGTLSDRVQLALLGQFRLFRTDSEKGGGALTLGGGVSTGGYSWSEWMVLGDMPAHKTIERAYWGNLELGAEGRFVSGVALRGFLGYGRMLNPSELRCVGANVSHCEEDHRGDGEGLIYLGFAVGYVL